MKRFVFFVFVCTIPFMVNGCGNACGDKKDVYSDLPFEMEPVVLPQIPDNNVALTDFGAVGDGTHLNTEAFRDAISSLSEKGGGRLVVPAGIWLTGPIEFADRIDLHLEKNALLKFSRDKGLYPLTKVNYGGMDMLRATSPIHAKGCHDIAISGDGIIDGGGETWRPVKRMKINPYEWSLLLETGGVLSEDGNIWYPDEACKAGDRVADPVHKTREEYDPLKIHTALRPVLVYLEDCKNILLEGCSYCNSPAWGIHPVFCKDLTVRGITVRNEYWAQNGDGIDIDSCENVLVLDSVFDVGDDAICLKSGKDEEGRQRGKPCRKVVVKNCNVYHGHGGFVIGSEMSGGISDVYVCDCRFIGTDVGLRFKSTRGRGGVVERVWIDNVYMDRILSEAVLFNMRYSGRSAAFIGMAGGHKAETNFVPKDETTPVFRDFHLSRLFCGSAARSVLINGLPEMPVRGIHFSDCVLNADSGKEIHNAEDIVFDEDVK